MTRFEFQVAFDGCLVGKYVFFNNSVFQILPEPQSIRVSPTQMIWLWKALRVLRWPMLTMMLSGSSWRIRR